MTVAKEIHTKIGSIKNTQKITYAMQMISASKMRKAQYQMNISRPYAASLLRVVQHIAISSTEFVHSYLIARPVKRAGFIVITSDRGMCGGLNANLFKTLLTYLKKYEENLVEIDLGLIGRKGEAFFKKTGGHIVAKADHMGDSPKMKNVIGPVKVMLDHYRSGIIDTLYIVYNQFIHTMLQTPKVQQLLPIVIDPNLKASPHTWDYIYEPNSEDLLNRAFNRYIEAQVYQALVENIACEQSARMMAMKNATENANNLINDLLLAYNKARQASITQELAEIVGGASAI